MSSSPLPTSSDSSILLHRSPRRPFGVTLLALISWILALVFLLNGIGFLSRFRAQDATSIDVLGIGFFLISSFVCILIGLGLWRLKRKTYWFVVVLCGVTAISQLVMWVQTGTLRWPGLFLYAGVLLYLLRPKVRTAFQ